MKRMRSVLAALLSGVLLFGAGYLAGRLYEPKTEQPEITAAMISSEILEVSELVTAELSYRGLVRVTDGQIPLLTRKSFGMVYTAEVKAGTDVSQADVTVTDERVTVRLPKSEVTSLAIDADGIRFYDEQWALFNWAKRDDVKQAISVAQENVLQADEIGELCARADEHAVTVLTELLTPMIGGRELTIRLG